MTTEERLKELEWRAFGLLIHDAAASHRESHSLCTEANQVLAYFVDHGVELLDVDDRTEEIVKRRVHPCKSVGRRTRMLPDQNFGS